MKTNTRTTKWATIAGVALAYALFDPNQVMHLPWGLGAWLLSIAKFAAVGGLVKLGIAAADAMRPPSD